MFDQLPMRTLCLTLCRLSIACWVGGATLFVATSIVEQRFAGFTPTVRDQLAVLRFPWYYGFGFTLVTASLVFGVCARNHPGVGPRAMRFALGLLAAALLVMLADYLWVYRPLHDLITPPGSPRSAEFARYHEWSKWINFGHGGLSLIAAALVCRPAESNGNG
ncbi:MAG: hypothetical protein ACREJB_10535 [Planctomycetaceae bacterium]